MIRWLALVLAALVCGGAVFFDRTSPASVESTQSVAAGRHVNPSLGDVPRLQAAWFCPFGSSSADGIADHEITIANLEGTPAVAEVSVLTAEGPVPSLRIVVPAFGSETKRLASLSDSELAGAVVEITGGEGVVGHSVTTSNGVAEGTCATQVSREWFFGNGRTTDDSEPYIMLMNPFDDAALYNVEFRIAGRPEPRQPEALQGQAIKPNSVVRLDLREYVTPEENLTVRITTRRGQIVAERLQMLNGSQGPQGASLQLGVANAAESWIFPGGRLSSKGGDQIVIWNTSETEASTVEVGFWPNNPEDRSTFSFIPVARELQPGRFEVIDLVEEGESFGITLPYELAVTVSADGAPVVAERWHLGEGYFVDDDATDPEAGDAEAEDPAPDEEEDEGAAAEESPYAQPTASTGLATSRGVEVVADKWVVPWARVNGSQLVITAAEDTNVRVRILADGQLLAEPTIVAVPARGRTLVDLEAVSPNGAVVVESFVEGEDEDEDEGEGEQQQPPDIAVELQVVAEDGALDIVPAVPAV